MGEAFCSSEHWDDYGNADLLNRMGGGGGNSSVSGHERNHLFYNVGGDQFVDISLISGIDDPGDARTMVMWDFDRDGWQDIAVVNANAPLLRVFRNRLGEIQGDQSPNRFVAVELEGANSSASQSVDQTSRDGYGAIVRVKTADHVIMRESRCGEGFAGQNSRILIIGIGDHESVESITVEWPSGSKQSTGNVNSNTLISFRENDDSALSQRPYAHRIDPSQRADVAGAPRITFDSPTSDKPLRVYVSTATWCLACKKAIPFLQAHVDRFGENVDFIGIPIDPKDTPEKLDTYLSDFGPPYQLKTDLSDDERTQFIELVEFYDSPAVTPSTVITDAEGNVLYRDLGVPSFSQIQRFLVEAGGNAD